MLDPTDLTTFRAGELIVYDDFVTSEALVGAVYDLFSEISHLEALAIVDENKPVGLITRSKLLFMLSRRFGYDLYARSPIIAVADTAPLIVSESELLDVVIDMAFARSAQEIYDEIVVTAADGRFLGLLSVKQLVIEQSNALARSTLLQEMALARNEELERISQVKSQFLANVTHELRSPVNALVGLAELLKRASDEGSMELVRERLAFLMSTASNLRGVINNILDLSKMEAGKMEVACLEVDVVPLLSEIAETTRILVGCKPVAVTVTVAGDRVLVHTDPMKLRQIVINLASNAAKFTDAGSIDLRLVACENKIDIEVCDTGIGIREADLHMLYTAFGQVEDAATKTREGTGLGLAISKNLAHLIGGTISVTSTYGKGSKFTLSLPLPHHET